MKPAGQIVSFFGSYLPHSPTEEFLLQSKHPIYELEIFPLVRVIAVKEWAKFILGKLVVHYLDNDAARSAFVRAHASTDFGNALIICRF